MSDDHLSFRQNALKGAWAGVKDSRGIAIAGGLFAFVFGVLALHHGVPFIEAFLLNTVVYAGALQMVSIPYWHHQLLPTLSLVSLAFMVSMRYLLMGMVTHTTLDNLRGWKVYVALFFVADENWVLTVLKAKTHTNQGYMYGYFLASGMYFYTLWVIFGLAGMLLAPEIKHPEVYALDFAFLAIFLAMLVAFVQGKRDIVPFMVAAICALVVERFFHGTWHIVAGALAGSLVGVWRDYHVE